MLSLVCLDVDGTLVGSLGEPTDVLWAASERARGRGQHLTLCTARLAAGLTRGWAERLDPDGWHVFHTGAAIWRPATDEVVTRELSVDAVGEAAEIARRHGWVFEAYSWDDIAADSADPLAIAHFGLLGMDYQRRAPNTLDGPIVRVQFVVPIGDTALALAAAPDGCVASAATSPVMRTAAFVSVTVAGVSKANGVTMVAGKVGAEMADVMMVGDGENDLSAMAVVGWPVAIGDAAQEVIETARIVVANVDDNGAAEAIDRSANLTG